MSKKIKPNKLFEEPQHNDENDAADSNSKLEVDVDINPVVGTGRMSAEDARKLEQFDAMEKSLAAISQEKSELESKVAEYVIKLEDLKNASNDVMALKDEIESLKKRCKDLESKNEHAIELESALKSAKDENDKYLVKISELSFENAALTAQLADIEKKMKQNGNVVNQRAFSPSNGPIPIQGGLASPSRDPYNPYANNGYGTW